MGHLPLRRGHWAESRRRRRLRDRIELRQPAIATTLSYDAFTGDWRWMSRDHGLLEDVPGQYIGAYGFDVETAPSTETVEGVASLTPKTAHRLGAYDPAVARRWVASFDEDPTISNVPAAGSSTGNAWCRMGSTWTRSTARALRGLLPRP